MKDKNMLQTSQNPMVKDLIKSIMQPTNDKCIRCDEPSDYGAHGLNGGEVYSIYYCEKHYFSMKRGSA